MVFYHITILFALNFLGVHSLRSHFEGYPDSAETIFVFEMIRHGSRAPNMKTPTANGFFGEGVKLGDITTDGRI